MGTQVPSSTSSPEQRVHVDVSFPPTQLPPKRGSSSDVTVSATSPAPKQEGCWDSQSPTNTSVTKPGGCRDVQSQLLPVGQLSILHSYTEAAWTLRSQLTPHCPCSVTSQTFQVQTPHLCLMQSHLDRQNPADAPPSLPQEPPIFRFSCHTFAPDSKPHGHGCPGPSPPALCPSREASETSRVVPLLPTSGTKPHRPPGSEADTFVGKEGPHE